MRTSEKALAPLLLGLVLAQCAKEYVLPPELADMGSLASARYVTRHVYPARGISLQVMRPRLGDPALLHGQGQPFELVFYTQHPSDATGLRFALYDELDPATEHALDLEAPASCDASGLCRGVAAAVAPPALPLERLLTLCVHGPDNSDCQSGAVYRFAAVPDPLRLAVIADPHVGRDDDEPTEARRLAKVFDAIASREPPVDLAVVVGDLTEDGAADMQEQFLSVARTFGRPLLLVPGNHDFNDGNIDEYLGRVLPHLDHVNRLGPYVLVGLNSGPMLSDQGGPRASEVSYGLEAAQIEWLAQHLAPEDQVELVYLHHPPFALLMSIIGSHRDELLATCEAGGVDVILAGHTHMNEVYDRAGIAQGLDPRCDELPGRERLPLSLITARATERSAGFREVVVEPTGVRSYCWFDVAVD